MHKHDSHLRLTTCPRMLRPEDTKLSTLMSRHKQVRRDRKAGGASAAELSRLDSGYREAFAQMAIRLCSNQALKHGEESPIKEHTDLLDDTKRLRVYSLLEWLYEQSRSMQVSEVKDSNLSSTRLTSARTGSAARKLVSSGGQRAPNVHEKRSMSNAPLHGSQRGFSTKKSPVSCGKPDPERYSDLSAHELQLRLITTENELSNLKRIYDQLINEEGVERFDFRRINLLKSQLMQLERQIVL